MYLLCVSGRMDIFVETGTYKGDSVQDALDLGFKVVISVEKNKTFYQECFERSVPALVLLQQ